MAVGLDGNAYRGTGGPLTEKWNGRTWKIVPREMERQDLADRADGLPAGAISGELFSVSCKSAAACVAVGLYLDSADAGIPLAETWNGRTWTPSTLPTPAGGTGVILNGVSCAAVRRCVAVGEYFTGKRRRGGRRVVERRQVDGGHAADAGGQRRGRSQHGVLPVG